jgi:hypothetical protein
VPATVAAVVSAATILEVASGWKVLGAVVLEVELVMLLIETVEVVVVAATVVGAEVSSGA